MYRRAELNDTLLTPIVYQNAAGYLIFKPQPEQLEAAFAENDEQVIEYGLKREDNRDDVTEYRKQCKRIVAQFDAFGMSHVINTQ